MEGSTCALLWAHMWATHCAHTMDKPCLAFGANAGELSAANRHLVWQEASRTDLITTRSQAAADRLRASGVTAPIQVTADNAFGFQAAACDEDWLRRVWPQARSGLVGLAAAKATRGRGVA